MIKCRRGLAKDFTKENLFHQMHQKTDFNGEMFMISVRLLAARKNLVHDIQAAKCDSTIRQWPTFFLIHPVYIFFTALLYIVLI